ncbi:hypothetical protein [Yunchengibacter salinarum]|uniref:hypothetical protein n=1 Tax=Yunchengibacter salinarum TaxID=3133399 RepID=UPI0035B638AB
MLNAISREFLQTWQRLAENGGGADLPAFDAVRDALGDLFAERGFCIHSGAEDFWLADVGRLPEAEMGPDLEGRPIGAGVPEAFAEVNRDLVSLCFRKQAGSVALLRYSFGHRHKDVEVTLLPVRGEGGTPVLAGLFATFVEPDDRDDVNRTAAGSFRLLAQDYLSLGSPVQSDALGGLTRSVLSAMGTFFSIDGEEVKLSGTGLLGGRLEDVVRATRPNVLAVAPVRLFGGLLGRLGSWYNLKMVETRAEAADIIAADSLDVVITAEKLPDGSGLDIVALVQEAQPYSGTVMILEPREDGVEDVIRTPHGEVHCLVHPVGEFSLLQTVRAASRFQVQRFRNAAAATVERS